MAAIMFLSFHSGFAQDGYFHPEREGDKWGVLRNYNKVDRRGNTDYTSEWTHKAKWDLVLQDTIRCSYIGNGCSGFFSFRKGKMGYLWSDGRSLSNDYDAMDIYHHIAKMNGKWGGFDEDKNILSFEYDSLQVMDYGKLYKNRDTSAFGFAAKKNGKWGFIAVRSWTEWKEKEIVEVLPFQYDDYVKSYSDAVVKKEGHWYFMTINRNTAPAYSQPYDSIKNVWAFWTVMKDKKWAPVWYDKRDPATAYEWDEISKCPGSYDHFIVKRDGVYGLIAKDKGTFKTIITPQASAIEIKGEKYKEQIVAIVNGVTTTFDTRGQMLSGSGDMSVTSTSVKGPFKINYHSDKKISVLDNASGKTIFDKCYANVEFVNDPVAGDVLKIKKLPYDGASYGKYARYQHRTGTMVGDYDNDFENFGTDHFSISVNGSHTFWSQKDYHQLKLPFAPRRTKTSPSLFISDNSGNWYTFSENPTKVDAGTLVDYKNDWKRVITYNHMEDGSNILTSLNGQAMNQKIDSMGELYDKKMLALKLGGVNKTYAYDGSKAAVCNYTLGQGTYMRECMEDDGTGAAFLWVDSSDYTLLINPISNKRVVMPCKRVYAQDSSQPKSQYGYYPSVYFVRYNNINYKLCATHMGNGLKLCRTEKCSCGNGRIITGTHMEGTEDKYVKPKSYTTTSSNYERTWNANTRQYDGVTTKTTTSHTDPGYTIKGTRHEVNEYGTCPRCNGKGKREFSLTWDGSSFK
jgi:hypothetical protein